jgi:hypothetical protein
MCKSYGCNFDAATHTKDQRGARRPQALAERSWWVQALAGLAGHAGSCLRGDGWRRRDRKRECYGDWRQVGMKGGIRSRVEVEGENGSKGRVLSRESINTQTSCVVLYLLKT